MVHRDVTVKEPAKQHLLNTHRGINTEDVLCPAECEYVFGLLSTTGRRCQLYTLIFRKASIQVQLKAVPEKKKKSKGK